MLSRRDKKGLREVMKNKKVRSSQAILETQGKINIVQLRRFTINVVLAREMTLFVKTQRLLTDSRNLLKEIK